MTNLNIVAQQFGSTDIRFVDHPEGKYEFGIVAADLAYVLEIQRTDDLVSSVDEDYKGAASIRTPGGAQSMTIIWEPGVYEALAKSRKPNAKPFQRWVFEEVLPSIRKTGSYSVQTLTPGQLLKLQADALIAIEEQQRQQAEEINQIKAFLSDADNLARTYIAKGDITPPSELTLTTKINLIVRSYCNQTNSDYRTVWNDVYHELKLREHIDVYTRHRNAIGRGDIPKTMNKLNYAVERLGIGEKLYSVVVACCVQDRWSSVKSIVGIIDAAGVTA